MRLCLVGSVQGDVRETSIVRATSMAYESPFLTVEQNTEQRNGMNINELRNFCSTVPLEFRFVFRRKSLIIKETAALLLLLLL